MAEKEYIERDMYYQKINGLSKGGCGDYPLYCLAINDCMNVLDEMPAADVAPVKHGCWEVSFLPRSYYGSDHDYEYTECECSVTCSNCHGIASCFPWKKQEDSTGFIKAYQKGMIKNAKTNYCPNCGAKMGGGDLNGS